MTSPSLLDNGSRAGSPDSDVRVLVIDGSLSIRQGLSRDLHKLGLEVSEASGAQAGLAFPAQQRCDLIITDSSLPGLDGLDLCRQLKSNPATKSTPVIIVSSRDAEEDIEKCFEAGPPAFVSKLDSRQELRRHIDDVLDRSFFVRNRMALVVDDSRLIRAIAREGLARAGFNVITAENGFKALEQLRLRRPDLIISDRPYRRGIARERAMLIIDEAGGDELCPECVSAFMQRMQSPPTSLAE